MRIKEIKDKISNNFKKHKFITIVAIFLWILLIVLTLISYKSTLGNNTIGSYDTTNVVELNKEETIEQIIPVKDKSNSMGIKFVTYRRTNKGNVSIKVSGNDSGIVYYESTVSVKRLTDNDFYIIDLSQELNNKNDKSIIITLTSDSNKGEAVGIYYSDGIDDEGNKLSINNKDIDGTISHVVIIQDDILKHFSVMALIVIITVLTLLFLWLILFNPNLYVFFPILVLIGGLIFVFIMSPLSPPDETIHYEFSLQESNRIMFNHDIYDVDAQYIDYMTSRYYSSKTNRKEAYKDLILNFNSKYIKGNSVDYYDVSIDNVYSLPFVPQAIGLAIARVLNLNPIKTFYFGRITNLLFYVLCIYICLRNLPVHKTFVGIISSLPILLQQSSSYSYDSFINGICFVIIGYVFKWLYLDEQIKVKDYIIAFVACLLIAPAKYIYGLLSLLFWLVPTKRFSCKRNKIILTLILCAPMLYQILPMVFPAIRFVFKHVIVVNAETITSGSEVVTENKLYTIRYAIRHFGETLSLVLRTVRYNLRAWFYESIGRYLSELTLILPITIVRIIEITLVLAVFIKENVSVSIIERIFFIGVCVAIALFALAGMLLSETHIGDEYISGVQGRYFCSLLPLFFVSFTNNKVNIKKEYNKYVVCLYLVVLFEVFIYILSYTFVN